MLLPLLAMRKEFGALRAHAGSIGVVGAIGSAAPFVLFGVASQVLPAGAMSILNATTPMWGALIAWAWLGDRVTGMQALGLLTGFMGVAGLAWDSASLPAAQTGIGATVAIGACLLATVCYGFVATFTRQSLQGVPSMAVAAGSQTSAALLLALPAFWHWPASTPSTLAWSSAAALSILCTGVAYVLYFRLIARIGAARATTVTFLIPLFAVLWGTLLLGEPLTLGMIFACAFILLGTSLATGWWKPRRRA